MAAYARVSSNSEDQIHSFAAQNAYFSKLITDNPDWELADIYADQGITGTSTKKRTEFLRMIRQCRQGKIDMILDGGEVDIGLESTIVDVSTDQPMILRPGYISQAMLKEVIGPVEIDRALLLDSSKAHPKAPGMKYKHYAPKADLKIVEGREDEVIAAINRLVEQGNKAGEKVGVIATEETKGLYEGGIVKSIGSRKDELSIARHLFGILRDFDELKVDRIYSEAFDTPRMGQAIMNRLMKAAGHQVISLGEKKDEKV